MTRPMTKAQALREARKLVKRLLVQGDIQAIDIAFCWIYLCDKSGAIKGQFPGFTWDLALQNLRAVLDAKVEK